MQKRRLNALVPGSIFLGLMMTIPLSLHAQGQGSGGGLANIEAGQPDVALHATVDGAAEYRANNGNANGHANGNGNGGRTGGGSGPSNVFYHGGVSDGSAGSVGVETAPKVYLVFWGAQWKNNDPSGEAAILESFYGTVGGSSWLNSVTQYCQGITSGTAACSSTVPHADQLNPTGIFAGYLNDTGTMAPAHPKQSELAAEAIRAAMLLKNTSVASNANAQYVIATAHGSNATGFGSQYCAWHSAAGSSYGDISYTNLPYMTDAGASCGAGFNGLGLTAGITIVAGHEMAESITDQFASGGWIDQQGEEVADKCAWIQTGTGASASVTLTNNVSFPVQSLWSNASNGGSCVTSY